MNSSPNVKERFGYQSTHARGGRKFSLWQESQLQAQTQQHIRRGQIKLKKNAQFEELWRWRQEEFQKAILNKPQKIHVTVAVTSLFYDCSSKFKTLEIVKHDKNPSVEFLLNTNSKADYNWIWNENHIEDKSANEDIFFKNNFSFVQDAQPFSSDEESKLGFRLTYYPCTDTSVGAVWYNKKINISSDFEISFDFKIEKKDIYTGAEGFAFVIRSSKQDLNVIGNGGDGLGFEGLQNYVAFKFDTFAQNNKSFSSKTFLPNTNVISIEIPGKSSPMSSMINQTQLNRELNDNNKHSVTITYRCQTFEIELDREMILTQTMDLEDHIQNEEDMYYMGFTAATNAKYHQHYEICNFSLKVAKIENQHTTMKPTKPSPYYDDYFGFQKVQESTTDYEIVAHATGFKSMFVHQIRQSKFERHEEPELRFSIQFMNKVKRKEHLTFKAKKKLGNMISRFKTRQLNQQLDRLKKEYLDFFGSDMFRTINPTSIEEFKKKMKEHYEDENNYFVDRCEEQSYKVLKKLYCKEKHIGSVVMYVLLENQASYDKHEGQSQPPTSSFFSCCEEILDTPVSSYGYLCDEFINIFHKLSQTHKRHKLNPDRIFTNGAVQLIKDHNGPASILLPIVKLMCTHSSNPIQTPLEILYRINQKQDKDKFEMLENQTLQFLDELKVIQAPKVIKRKLTKDIPRVALATEAKQILAHEECHHQIDDYIKHGEIRNDDETSSPPSSSKAEFRFIFPPRIMFWIHLSFYFIFLCCLMGSAWHDDSETSPIFSQQYVMKNIVVDSDLYSISSTDSFWEWLYNFVSRMEQSISSSPGVLQIIGVPIIRQFKVSTTDSCQFYNPITNVSITCLLDLSSTSMDKGGFNATSWSDNIGDQLRQGFLFFDTPIGGYYKILNLNSSLLNQVLELQNQAWIDEHTRRVIIQWGVFSPNTGIIGLLVILIEYSATGLIFPTITTLFFSIESVTSSLSAISITVLLFAVGYLVAEFRQVTKEREDKSAALKDYFTSYSNYIDLTVYIGIIVILLLKATLFPSDLNPYITSTEELRSLSNASFILLMMYSVLISLATVRLFYYFNYSSTIGPIVVAIKAMSYNVMIFILIDGIILFIFSQIFTALLSTLDMNYRNYSTSLFILLQATLSQFEFFSSTQTGTDDIMYFFSNFILAIFVLFTCILLVNLLIAMMSNSFENVAVQDKKADWSITYVWLILKELDEWPSPLNLFYLIVWFSQTVKSALCYSFSLTTTQNRKKYTSTNKTLEEPLLSTSDVSLEIVKMEEEETEKQNDKTHPKVSSWGKKYSFTNETLEEPLSTDDVTIPLEDQQKEEEETEKQNKIHPKVHYHFVREAAPDDEETILIQSLLKTFNNNQSSKTPKPDESQTVSKIEKFSRWDVIYHNLKPEQNQSIMHLLYDRFYEELELSGKFLVSQHHVEDSQKNIKISVQCNSGRNFATNELFFKQPKDICLPNSFWMYGVTEEDTNAATKATRKLIYVLSHFMEADTKKHFKVPLCGIIDYCGFRFEAVARLPIGDTLVYGSNDGGRTVFVDKEISDKLKPIADAFHLKQHRIIKSLFKMQTCGHIEIHKLVFQNKEQYFVLDPIRLFPPLFPLKPGTIFYQKFRAEFLRDSIFSLSSDAFTDWQGENEEQEKQNIRKATEELLYKATDYVKKFSQNNESLVLYKFFNPLYTGIPGKEDFVRDFQSKGINMRFLGNMAMAISIDPCPLRDYILSLLISRVIKNLWRKKILKEQNRGNYVLITNKSIGFITTNFSSSDEWNEILVYAQEMFVFYSEPEHKISLKETLDKLKSTIETKVFLKKWICYNFCETCGIKINPNNAFVKFQPIISFLPKLVYFKAIQLIEKAKKKEQRNANDKELKRAVRMLQSIIGFTVDVPNILEHLAKATSLINKNERPHFFSFELLRVDFLKLDEDIKTKLKETISYFSEFCFQSTPKRTKLTRETKM